MAEVKNVVLAPITPVGADKLKVDVSYKLVFSPAEAGKQFKVSINLFGEDLAGDDEPAGPALNGPQPIYTFSYGLAPATKKYKIITAVAGEQSVVESPREVDKGLLDEDPGITQELVQGVLIKHPHADEVYAVVSLSGEARSNTFQITTPPQ
ncbi:MAG: hypothetical protein LC785_04565 [Acidobacteria bacterium]|nr:hypothetical protein [Acidobacteriota bacterium]MCA1641256.1 hypothetical protein [Acidobacteriota bacterium]